MDGYVTVVGSLNYDMLVKQDRLPLKGETFRGEKIVRMCGGKGSNQAAQCGKLDLPAYMIGKVGNDQFGTELVNSLNNFNVNTSFITNAFKETSGMAVVQIMPDGDYYSTIIPGANNSLSEQDIRDADDLLKNTRLMIFQLENPIQTIETAMTAGKKHGAYIILNAAPALSLTQQIIASTDMLIVNESEAEFYSGNKVSTFEDAKKACETLRSIFHAVIILTMGKEGSVAYDGERHYKVEAISVTSVDATGAGDSYTAAIAYGLYYQMSLEASMQLATEVSAYSVQQYGGQESFPFKKDINYLKSTPS